MPPKSRRQVAAVRNYRKRKGMSAINDTEVGLGSAEGVESVMMSEEARIGWRVVRGGVV